MPTTKAEQAEEEQLESQKQAQDFTKAQRLSAEKQREQEELTATEFQR